MEFQVLCIGKMKDDFFVDQIKTLKKQIDSGKHAIEILEFKDKKIPEKISEKNKESFIEAECAPLMERIKTTDYVIALCIEGRELSNSKHVELLKKAGEQGYRRVVYVIGGSLGLPEKLKKRADFKLSFSKMTFPHQMMRMLLCEELAVVSRKLYL